MRLGMRPSVLLVCFALAACPRPFNPRETGLPSGGAQEAKGRFETARAHFAQNAANSEEFQAIVRDYPDDPVAPYAELYAGMAAHKQGDDAAAATALARVESDDKAPDEVRQRARFWLGIADAATGKAADAERLLTPFDGKVDGDEQVELDAALAEAAAAQGHAEVAITHYEAFFRRGRPAERAYVATRVAALVDGLPAERLGAVFDSVEKDGPTAAYLARRYAAALRAEGHADRAQRVID